MGKANLFSGAYSSMQNQTAMQAPAQPAAAQQFDSVTSVTEFDSAASRPRVGEQLRALEFERDATRTSSAPVLRELADDRNVARTSRAHSTAEQQHCCLNGRA